MTIRFPSANNRTAVTVSGEYKVEKGEKGVYTACDDVADQNSAGDTHVILVWYKL